jgi:hypothetical protein
MRQLATDQAKVDKVARQATRQGSQKVNITVPIEAKDSTKKALRDAKALKGSKKGVASGSKGIGSSSGSRVRDRVEVVEAVRRAISRACCPRLLAKRRHINITSTA